MKNLSLGSRVQYLVGASLVLFLVFNATHIRDGMTTLQWVLLLLLT